MPLPKLVSLPTPPLDRDRPAHSDRTRAIAAVRDLLEALGEDVSRPGMVRTPARFADLLMDLFADLGTDPAGAVGDPIRLEDATETGDLVSMIGISFRSICEHHLMPFDGVVDIFIAPRDLLAGFSRVVGVVESASRRPQLQERLGQQVADALMSALDPHGVVVRVAATHGCIAHLEPHARATKIVTVARAGSIPDSLLAVALGSDSAGLIGGT